MTDDVPPIGKAVPFVSDVVLFRPASKPEPDAYHVTKFHRDGAKDSSQREQYRKQIIRERAEALAAAKRQIAWEQAEAARVARMDAARIERLQREAAEAARKLDGMREPITVEWLPPLTPSLCTRPGPERHAVIADLPTIVKIVCGELGLAVADAGLRKRLKSTIVREFIVWFARRMTGHSYPEIARFVSPGTINHNTYSEAYSRIALRMVQNQRPVPGACLPGKYGNRTYAEMAEFIEARIAWEVDHGTTGRTEIGTCAANAAGPTDDRAAKVVRRVCGNYGRKQAACGGSGGVGVMEDASASVAGRGGVRDAGAVSGSRDDGKMAGGTTV